ncbi:hypothetical protein ACR79S_20275 [Sphingobacterium spiritivorum]|uniref:hypothetical protein n=1 Tax=Sphingobacterium spiritivorum TaxID=258 RepID=UPI003DA256DA
MASYTGLTDITIPLYTVNSKKLSIPITISFHASGRMANETNGVLGMRWTLNCGGLVSRTRKGEIDEWNELTAFDFSPYTNNHPVEPTFDILHNASVEGKINVRSTIPPIYDSEYDLFNYALPNGKSGHFILKNKNGLKVPMLIPYDPLKIEVFKDQSAEGFIDRVKITDVDGTQYFFGKADQPAAYPFDNSVETRMFSGQPYVSTPCAWYLVKIISGDNTDEITFSYTKRDTYSVDALQSAKIGDRLAFNNIIPINISSLDTYGSSLFGRYGSWLFEHDADPTTYESLQSPRYQTPTLSAIKFNGNSVSFNYITVPEHTGGFGSLALLSEVIVNRGTTPFRKIKFNLVKHAGESELYYLDGMSLYGEKSDILNEKYTFSYYEPAAPNKIEGVISSAKKKDWWGYYQSSVTQLLLPRDVQVLTMPLGYNLTYRVGAAFNRESDENDQKFGMLKSIIYPTGGETEFIYEGNKFNPADQPGSTNKGPGLRIREVISKPLIGKNIHKVYKYGVNEDGVGVVNEYLKPGSLYYSELTENDGVDMHFWNYNMNGGEGSLLGVNKEQNAGFRIRNYYADPYVSFNLSGSPIKYGVVAEYYLEDALLQQKIQTHYVWGQAQNNGNLENVEQFRVLDYSFNTRPRYFASAEFDVWRTPVMNEKYIYKYSNGQFSLIRKEMYNYTSLQKDEARDMPVYQHSVVSFYRGAEGIDDRYTLYQYFNSSGCSVYGYGVRKYATGAQLLTKTTSEEYTPSGIIITVKNISYDSVYLFVKNEEIINSNNKSIKTTYTYPHNFQQMPVYQKMVQKNILSPVIEQTYSNAAIQTKKVITNYYNPFENIFVPRSVEMKNGSFPQETVANFNHYSKQGNILEQQKLNDVKESYIWGYNNQYPIAKVVNAANALSTLTVTYPVTYGSVFLDPSQSTKEYSFTTGASGNVGVSVSDSYQDIDFTVYYELRGNGVNRSGYLRHPAGGVPTGPSDPQSIVINNVPVGTYTLLVRHVNSTDSYVYGEVLFNYITKQDNYSGNSEVFLENFEETTSSYIVAGGAYSGEKYLSGMYNVNFAPAAGKKYLIQWWAKVNGKWILNQQSYTGSFILSGAIDNVRIFPEDAFITSYTYDPLIGMTSETDPSGRTTFYEYDGFGRLSVVKDDIGNIIKKICYNYKGQIIDCN